MKIVFATHNNNKLIEVQSQLGDKFNILSLNDINCHGEIPETSETIEGNAILKADYVTKHFKMNCFADDTGLEVEVLDGAPGVYSARYAGEQKNSEDNIDKLLQNLENKPNRKAQFKTVIALNIHGEQHLFTGICKGSIAKERSGNMGFGYDSVFLPEGSDKTFAEMNLQEKAVLSHRGLAVKKLISFLYK
jgi:XTP/dITP diphosphohydrolase